MSTRHTSTYRIPGFFLPHIADFVASTGGDVDQLYRAAGIDRKTFVARDAAITEDQFYAIARTAITLCKAPAFGLEIGQRFSLGSFGLLSRALMSCATLRDAAHMLERYSVLALPLVRLYCHETESAFVLEITALSRYPDLNQTMVEALIACATKLLPLLLGPTVKVEKICCQFDAPPYACRFTSAMAKDFEFGAAKNLIHLKLEIADVELMTANPIDARSAMQECEQALISSLQTKRLTDKVSDHVRYYLDTNPSSKDIAKHLSMTERTLRRKLAEEGTSYRVLVQGIREEMAKYYLSQTQLQVTQIAFKLGYAETSNFRSAFKVWTGKSPRAWRQNV